MFNVETEEFGDLYRIKLVNVDTGEYVFIIPEYGGNITEISLKNNKKQHSILDGSKTYADLMSDTTYKGAKLLPFPNRINQGRYSFQGKIYQLPINSENHAIHGFIFNKIFQVVNQSATQSHASLELQYLYDGAIKGYPFKFNTQLIYSLANNSKFKFTTIITNVSSSPIPVGDGWHLYFKTESRVDNLRLKLPSNRKLVLDNQMIPTGEFVFEDNSDSFMINNRQFDTCFALDEQEEKVTTEIYDPVQDFSINIWQETGKMKYNFLQVFIPESRDSIAIEPMTCTPDAFNNNIGLVVLAPNQSLIVSCGVFVS